MSKAEHLVTDHIIRWNGAGYSCTICYTEFAPEAQAERRGRIDELKRLRFDAEVTVRCAGYIEARIAELEAESKEANHE